ncbi:sugar ABC transporter permease [Paenibacillus sp. FSL W8-1187]|uniref:N-Acetyl-D-glucosamine ABC transport system, permease protein 1 n=1 Tax=Paenibacillus pasadenensis TaxID=217090 RepID=A0A2N5NCM2_9BACL|nr:sugar ABC transporter permease [Paenibacillus pasadenensis]PLT48091.1 N-Acetyl-D-glucosamine ABC transport system, permease protein 1 [Paenibacillus pasadenensis]
MESSTSIERAASPGLSGETERSRFKRLADSPYLFILPYAALFTLLIVLPVAIAAAMSFTSFNTVEFPRFVGFQNYIDLFTGDSVFLQHAVTNTLLYGAIVGPIGYMLAFLLAWMLSQVPHRIRTLYTVILYSPSITGPVMMTVVWKVLFSGDQTGYLNYWFMKMNLIKEPVQWLQAPDILVPIMIFIALWGSMGVGFLAMLAGLLNIDKTMYEAAYIDGIRNRWQEIFFITIPSMKPQMLFGAVMAIIGTFNASGMAAALSGGTPPPQYAGWLIVDHANDFGFIRYEMGYASAVTVVLLYIVILFNKVSYKLFGDKS